MRIHIEVEDWVVSQLEQLRTSTGSSDYKELFNNATGLLAWAVQQHSTGRTIASIDEHTKEFRRLQMPALEYAAYVSEEHGPKRNVA